MRAPKPMVQPIRPTKRQELLGAGVSLRTLRSHVTQGMLVAVRHGVYVSAEHWPADPAGRHQVRSRAEVAVFPDAVISHNSAALLWGLPTPDFGEWWDLPPTVTLPPQGHRSRTGQVTYRRAGLAQGEVLSDAYGYPVTSPARTAVDLALGRTLPASLVLFDAAARLIIASMISDPRRHHYASPLLVEEARALFQRSITSKRTVRLGEVAAAFDPARESPAESLSAGHMLLAGLPMPSCQAELRTEAGRFYPDFYWKDRRLIGECDGAVKYREPAGYVAEKEREQALRDLGYRFVRWQAREIMTDPDRVIERIARALNA